jgi:hypothetical protein
MGMEMKQLCCPHCGAPLQPFELPDQGGWDIEFHIACFNDDCDYYRKGWEWMEEKFGVRSSYRYRLNPASGTASPLAVWSPDAIKSRILDAELTVEDDVADALPCDSRPV